MKYIIPQVAPIIKQGAPTMSDTDYDSGTTWFDAFNNVIYFFFIVETIAGKGNLLLEKRWLKLDNTGLSIHIITA